MEHNDEELHEVPYAAVIQYLSYPSPTQKPIMNSSLQNMENGEGYSLTHLYPSQGLYDIPFIIQWKRKEHWRNLINERAATEAECTHDGVR